MTTGTLASAATGATLRPFPAAAATVAEHGPSAFEELEGKIRAGMERFGVPGVAVAVLHRGVEHVRGYGVTNVDYPVPVDGDTVFRIGSVTKTFTGTAVMRLVERGDLQLDATVRRYLPTFRTSDPAVGDHVTVRQLLNHSAGWLGEDFQDTGQGDEALERFVAGMARLPQLTTPGTVFAYNNAALSLTGRLVEVVTGQPYETAVRSLVIEPLGLSHSRFFADEVIGYNVAAPHALVDGKPTVEPSFYRMPRSLHPTGGLISSVRDQLRWARFHLGNGTVPDGQRRLLSRRSVVAMRTHPGPGGTLVSELDGMGLTWWLRPSAEGVRVVQNDGDWPGMHSGLIMVPRRRFALIMLTNSDGGFALLNELFVGDWALRRFAGVRDRPATPRALSARRLAEYEGSYLGQQVGADGVFQDFGYELTAERGQLAMRANGQVAWHLAFYRRDYVLVLDVSGRPILRANFVRGSDGRVAWFRFGGRLLRHHAGAPPRTAAVPIRMLAPAPYLG